jgi:hypothetical protein
MMARAGCVVVRRLIQTPDHHNARGGSDWGTSAARECQSLVLVFDSFKQRLLSSERGGVYGIGDIHRTPGDRAGRVDAASRVDATSVADARQRVVSVREPGLLGQPARGLVADRPPAAAPAASRPATQGCGPRAA